VYIVTVGQGDEKDGMLATWVSQVAFEPPILSIVVKKERPILSKLSFGSKLIVNVLGRETWKSSKSSLNRLPPLLRG